MVARTRPVIIGIGYGIWLRGIRSARATEHLGDASDGAYGDDRVGQGKVVVSTVVNGECDERQFLGQLPEIGEVCDRIVGSGDEFDRNVDVRQPSAAFG